MNRSRNSVAAAMAALALTAGVASAQLPERPQFGETVVNSD